MLAVKVEAPKIDEVIQKFATLPDAIRRTVIFSLNDTVDDLHKRQLMEMDQAFDRPTAYVKRGLRKRYAAGRARPGFRAPGAEMAGIYFEDFPVGKSPEDIIKPHVYGGSRPLKRSERRLQQFGILPSGKYTVMGGAFEKNNNGNITGARYTQALSDLSTIDTASRVFKGKRKTRQFFVAKNESGQPIGIAERRGGKRVMMLVFTNAPQYKKRYRYFEVGQQQVMVSLPRHFNRIMNKEMRKHFP